MNFLNENLDKAKKIANYLNDANVGIKVKHAGASEYSTRLLVEVPAMSSIDGKTFSEETIYSMEDARSLVNSLK